MAEAAPTNKVATNRNRKRRPRKRMRKAPKQVVCQICHTEFKRITAEHLRTHGFTLTRYRRAYHAPTRAPAVNSAPTGTYGRLSSDPEADRQTVATLAERIVSDPQVIRELAGEVSEAIFGSSLRDALRLSLVSVLTERLKSHGEATAALNQVRGELSQPWRTKQGGMNGQPTSTKDLLGMATVLGMEVRQGEELLLKTVKLAMEEWRSHQGAGAIEGGLPDRFSGSGEAIPIPATLSAGDRETCRTLWGMFDKAIEAKRVLTVTTTQVDSVQTTCSVPGRIVTPQSDPQPALTVEGSAPQVTCTPLVGNDEPF